MRNIHNFFHSNLRNELPPHDVLVYLAEEILRMRVRTKSTSSLSPSLSFPPIKTRLALPEPQVAVAPIAAAAAAADLWLLATTGAEGGRALSNNLGAR